MSRSWPLTVEVQDDESISSWLVRAALTNGCDPGVLTDQLWPHSRAWTLDLDRNIPEEKILPLVDCSGLKKSDIERMGLGRLAKSCSARPLEKHGVWPWVQALGARGGRYRGGIQFCPLCFQEDTNPYYRKIWRFSWVSICDKHEVQLVERCARCRKPIEPHRLEAVKTAILSECSECGFDLRLSPTLPTPCGYMVFQETAKSAIWDGKAKIVENSLRVQDWFDTCRHLLLLIRRAVSSPNSTLSVVLRECCGDISLTPERLAFQLELLDVETRSELFRALHNLLNDLDSFFKKLSHCGSKLSSLENRQGEIPKSLAFLTECMPKAELSFRARGCYESCKPRSKETVLKSWARIQRKHRID